jgi:hypothetical protein
LENLVGAFAMVSSGEYSLDGNLETLRPMLGAFGVESDSRSIAFDDRREYGMSIGALVGEVFEEQEQSLEAGTRVFVDLEALNALSASAAPALCGEMTDREGFVGRYPRLYYASRTVEDQWLLRLQFGGDAHLGLAPVTGTASVPVAPGSLCAHEATGKALDDLEFVASVTPAERAKIAKVVIEELEAIAASCPDDALAQERIAFLVDAWSVRARSARE